jgi:hypothetical protein
MKEIFPLNFLKEPNEHDYVWRYMSIEKLSSFLKGELYLSPLNDFDDYYEGITPTHFYLLQFLNYLALLENKKYNSKEEGIRSLFSNIKFLPEILNLKQLQSRIANHWKLGEIDNLHDLIAEQLENYHIIEQNHEIFQKNNFCSCWFVTNNIEESYLMWKSYCNKHGVVIRIRYKDFKKLINDSLSYDANSHFKDPSITESFNVGLINYQDYKLSNAWSDEISKEKSPVFFKHYSYKNENELRVHVKKNDKTTLFNNIFTFASFQLYGKFDIIINPWANFLEYYTIENMIKDNNTKADIYFSELSHGIYKKPKAKT